MGRWQIERGSVTREQLAMVSVLMSRPENQQSLHYAPEILDTNLHPVLSAECSCS